MVLSNLGGLLSLGTVISTCTVVVLSVGRAWSEACTVSCTVKNRQNGNVYWLLFIMFSDTLVVSITFNIWP